MATPTDPHPPLPRLTFRVGVIGHRWNRLPRAAAPDLRVTIAQILQQALSNVASAHGPWYHPDPSRLCLVTSLAEGADRIGAAALGDLAPSGRQRIELHVVFPFGETAYRETFDHPDELPEFDRLCALASRTLVMDGRPTRFDGFVAGGRAVVDHCDLLIAVSDQAGSDGAGGTANQMAYALREGVPVVVVDPARPSLPWLFQPSEPDCGRAAGLSGLGPLIQRQLLPPDAADLRETYFAERHIRGYLGKAFRVVVDANQRGAIPILGWPKAWWRLVRGLTRPDFPVPYPDAAQAEWLARWSDPATLGPPVQGRLVESLAPAFGWADRLATYYAHRYRSAFATVFSLSWVAILMAVAGIYLHSEAVSGPVVSGLEVGLLLIILLVVSRGRSQHHHQRWLDYRALAERLRHFTFLWPLGRSCYLARPPRNAWDGDPCSDWTAWLVRAVVRDVGMPTGTLDGPMLEGCRGFLRHHEVAVQAAHHDATAARLAAVQHRVHPQVELAFGGALLAAVANLMPLLPWHVVGIPEWHYPAATGIGLTFASIVLPAFGAARHGFLGQADVLGSSMRSAALANRLREFQHHLDRLGPTEDLESLALGDLALEAARIMEADLANWRVVFRGKPLAPG